LVNFLHLIDFTIFLRIKIRGLRNYIRQVHRSLTKPGPALTFNVAAVYLKLS